MTKLSATARVREEMEVILKKKENENGLNFNELWNKLEDNKDLKKLMYTKENKKRVGILQGLSNRVKDNKIENVKIIKKGNQNVFIYFSNSLEYLNKLTQNYLEDARSLELLVVIQDLKEEDSAVFVSFENSLNELGDINVALSTLNSKLLKEKTNQKKK